MSAVRILHVDDEPDIREVVEISLGLDPGFAIHSCASGNDALTEAAEWRPHMILCDVMMPGMDGPATLARLRENPSTSKIPVVFMTARAQQREIDHFREIGAAGVICKPFDPMTLPTEVRQQMRTAGLAALSNGFAERLRADAAALSQFRAKIEDGLPVPIEEIRALAHALAGAAGIFGCDQIGEDAAKLEQASINLLEGSGAPDEVERELDSLLTDIAAAA
jgi:CheY-like chemotaxis protein